MKKLSKKDLKELLKVRFHLKLVSYTCSCGIAIDDTNSAYQVVNCTGQENFNFISIHRLSAELLFEPEFYVIDK